MFEEEHPVRGLKSITEGYLLCQLSLMGLFAGWLSNGVLPGASAYLACMGWLSVILIEGHRRHGFGLCARPIIFMLIALTPFWATLVAFLAGFLNPILEPIRMGDVGFYKVLDVNKWVPAHLLPSEAWMPLLLDGAIYCSALGLLMVALSAAVIRRLLIILCLSAVVISIIGYLQFLTGQDRLFATFRTESRFFGTFAHEHHYASFAMLWAIVLFGILTHINRRGATERPRKKWSWLLALGWLLLASSVFLTGTPLHAGLFLFGMGWCLCTEASYSIAKKNFGSGIAILLLGFCAVVCGVGLPIYLHMKGVSLNGVPVEVLLPVWRDSWELVLSRPLFGWGIGSYEAMMLLQQSSDLGLTLRTPHSDLLHILVEQGFWGLLFWITPALVLAYLFIIEPAKRLLSAHLWVAALMTAVMAAVSFPLQNPAVLWSLWIIIAAAYAWMRVQVPRADGPLRSTLVFDHKEMQRVPKLDMPLGHTMSRLQKRHQSEVDSKDHPKH